ncbi:hypothetical protein B0A50_06853 [Salinomyces thailandicus]|uniref:Uncharacterized protein n=1 Tax=Salinomyces thailandicus TaxID=706561 RepID=A0A4U0TPV0_9PEZI|nr:hypothetical protein B0A50_06853 [Salinomyces thailandica]
MHSARAPRRKFGTDINRYLGVELPEERILVPAPQTPRPVQRRNQSSNFSFRSSIAKVFSTAGTVTDMAYRSQSGSIRRWRNKSTSSAGNPSTPLHDRTNTTSTPSTMNNTTFLPELNSTPPMPTFQKPAMPSPRKQAIENATPGRAYPPSCRLHGEALPPIADPGRLLSNRGTMVGPALVDRVEETPPLPGGWIAQHDRAICVLDARNYPLQTIVTKVRRTFPQLRGILTPAMVDKRLRQLDQDVEIDYWRIGLQGPGASKPNTSLASSAHNASVLTTPSRTSHEPSSQEITVGMTVGTTLKTPMSGSLAKSPSVGNMMLPDTLSLSSEPSRTNVNALSGFSGGYRSQAV